MTLMILISATWTGLYLAKRITRPVQLLAAGAREIGAGHLDHRIEPETRDEFGSLVEAFNTMAGELAREPAASSSSRASISSARTSQLDERRRYIETILERIATGVISLGPDGQIETINGAALRLLEVDRDGRSARGRRTCSSARICSRSRRCSCQRGADGPSAGSRRSQEIALARDGREVHLAAAATLLWRDDGSAGGAVLVFDDVTPLIRTQRVAAWRDVARRLAHEIKNPLTPIQLSAERMRRQFSDGAGAGARARRRVHGDDRQRGRVAEGAGRRVRAVRADAGAARGADRSERGAGRDAGALQRPLPRDSDRAAASRPRCRRCASTLEQMRQVVINLVDNAVEALGGSAAGARPNGEPPTIVVETRHDRGQWRRADPGVATTARAFPPARSRQAVHAVLLDQAARQRPRPRDRAPHRRRARRQHRSGGQRPDAARSFTIELPRDDERRCQSTASESCELTSMKTTVLIVDDEAGVRSALSGVLRDEGYVVDAVDSGEACLDRVVRARLRRHRARHLAAGHGRPGDAGAAARAARRCAGRHDLRPRQHRVGGAGDQARRLRLRREAAVAREDGPRASATPCGSAGSRPRTARCARTSIGA